MARRKLTVKEQRRKYKICCLQKGDWVYFNNEWRQIRYIHHFTMCFDSKYDTWHRSTLASYSIHLLWRQIKFVIKESTTKEKWKK